MSILTGADQSGDSLFCCGVQVDGFKGAEGAEGSTGVVRRIKIKSAAKF